MLWMYHGLVDVLVVWYWMGDIDPNVNEVFVVGGSLVVLMFWCRLWHW